MGLAAKHAHLRDREAYNQIQAGEEIRNQIKIFCEGTFNDGCQGDLGSPKLHDELKPWAKLVLNLARSSGRISFNDIVMLNKFPHILKHITDNNQSSHLPPKVIERYETNILPLVISYINKSQEGVLLKAVQEFGQKHCEVAQTITDTLKKFGLNVPMVKQCTDAIRKYMTALASLADEPLDDDYTPQLDRLTAAMQDPTSPLHYNEKVFETAKTLLSIYANGLHVEACSPLIAEASTIDDRARTIAGYFSYCLHSKQRGRT